MRRNSNQFATTCESKLVKVVKATRVKVAKMKGWSVAVEVVKVQVDVHVVMVKVEKVAVQSCTRL